MSQRTDQPERDSTEDYCLPRNICPCLFTKTMSLNIEHRRHPIEDALFTGDTALFECTRTMSPFGLDDGDAIPERCIPGRACYNGELRPNPSDIT